MAACKTEGIMPGIHYSIPDAYNEGTVMFNGPVSAEYFELIMNGLLQLRAVWLDVRYNVSQFREIIRAADARLPLRVEFAIGRAEGAVLQVINAHVGGFVVAHRAEVSVDFHV